MGYYENLKILANYDSSVKCTIYILSPRCKWVYNYKYSQDYFLKQQFKI